MFSMIFRLASFRFGQRLALSGLHSRANILATVLTVDFRRALCSQPYYGCHQVASTNQEFS
jgi:hypothetical protein